MVLLNNSFIYIRFCLLFGIFYSLSSCNQGDFCKDPSVYFSDYQQGSILMQLTLKTAPAPEGLQSPDEIRAYYELHARSFFWHYAWEKNGWYYFLLSCPAPSLYSKRIGIGGKFKSEDLMSIRNYTEVFRTFKLNPEELEKKGKILFNNMAEEKDLRPWQAGGKNTMGEEWIEFPDQMNYFDPASQKWKIKPMP